MIGLRVYANLEHLPGASATIKTGTTTESASSFGMLFGGNVDFIIRPTNKIAVAAGVNIGDRLTYSSTTTGNVTTSDPITNRLAFGLNLGLQYNPAKNHILELGLIYRSLLYVDTKTTTSKTEITPNYQFVGRYAYRF